MMTEASNAAASEGVVANPLAELCQHSDAVFVGEVLSVGAPPKTWSGRAPSYQSVTYQVRQGLRGSLQGPVTVLHAVVRGGATAEPGETPRLAASLFKPGQSLVVFASRRDGGTWASLDERLGAKAATPEWVAEVRAACH